MGIVGETRLVLERLLRHAQPAAESASDGLGRTLDRCSPPAFAQLRRHRPIVLVGRLAIVTLAEDVREVLSDHEHCTVAHYASRMEAITGRFMLGEDDTPLYRRDRAALRGAMRSADLPLLEEASLESAREHVARSAGGEIDVVTELADPTLDRVLVAYLGMPAPNTETQLRWARSIFQELFGNVANLPTVRERALADAAEMRPHVDALIATRRAAIAAGAEPPDDVLTRLLGESGEAGLDPLAIRHNLIGVTVNWIPPVSKAFALAIEELLRRPPQLASAQRAARDGDRELVAAHLFEALRFRPQSWALLRVCAAERTLAAGTARETTIPAGATVLAATRSAMFDETAVTAPAEFRLDRPHSDYLHFGHGPHACLGDAIARVQLPALATALLEGARIERAPGRGGKLRWKGPYPSGLRVSLGPGPAAQGRI